MPQNKPHHDPISPIRPRVTTQDTYSLLDTYLHAGEDLVTRPWQLAADSMRRGISLWQQGLLGQNPAMNTVRALAQEYANFALGLVSTLPYAVENMNTRLADAPPGTLGQYDMTAAGADPADHGKQIFSAPDADPSWSYALPSRIVDSSQGWAGWFVPTAVAAAVLANRDWVDPVAAAAFVPLDCAGRTLVALQATDYRVGDLGAYREVALLLWVTPRDSLAAQPGMLFITLVVTAPASIAPARAVWGLPKHWFEDLAVDYRPQSAQFYTGQGDAGDFSLTLPRFGSGRSLEIPYAIVTAAPQDGGPARPSRSIFRRSGNDEGLQFGGEVLLHLGCPPAEGAPGSCFCSSGAPCLCDAVRALLPIDASQRNINLPAANGWTEWMCGSLGGPGVL